jgi:tRNA 2-selenouridine synthase SelU
MENNFKIKVFKDDEMDAFGAYASPSIKKHDFGVVLFNLEANLSASIEHEEISFKEMFVETIMHEVGHALEEFYDLEFNEDRIERIIESYRKKYTSESKE